MDQRGIDHTKDLRWNRLHEGIDCPRLLVDAGVVL